MNFVRSHILVCTGTYLGGRTIIGDVQRASGPDGLAAAGPLTESLRWLGDQKSTRLNSSHSGESRMPSSA